MSDDDQKIPDEISFRFGKANQFRVVYSDGAWGGITPRGMIQMAFYNERGAIPQTVTHRVSESGDLGEEVSRQTSADVFREVEVSVVMSPAAAQQLIEWLERHLKGFKSPAEQQEEE